jgi:hypothetical protein
LDESGQVAYPPGAVLTAKLMLDWLLSPESEKALPGGLKSESIGKYSHSIQEVDTESGYPKAILGRNRQYARGNIWA